MTSEQRPPVEHIDHEASVDVTVRRSPRYGRFLLIGAILGVLVALILTSVFGPSAEAEAAAPKTFSFGQVFGFMALVCIAAGALLSGLLALLLDRTLGRRTRSYVAEHDTVGYDEPEDEPAPAQPGDESSHPGTATPQAN